MVPCAVCWSRFLWSIKAWYVSIRQLWSSESTSEFWIAITSSSYLLLRNRCYKFGSKTECFSKIHQKFQFWTQCSKIDILPIYWNWNSSPSKTFTWIPKLINPNCYRRETFLKEHTHWNVHVMDACALSFSSFLSLIKVKDVSIGQILTLGSTSKFWAAMYCSFHLIWRSDFCDTAFENLEIFEISTKQSRRFHKLKSICVVERVWVKFWIAFHVNNVLKRHCFVVIVFCCREIGVWNLKETSLTHLYCWRNDEQMTIWQSKKRWIQKQIRERNPKKNDMFLEMKVLNQTSLLFEYNHS